MGSMAKRRAVAKFIETGEFEPDEGLESLGDAIPDAPLDAAWLADIQERKARLAANPEAELPEYRDFYKDPELTREQVKELLDAVEKAVGSPEAFYDEIDEALEQEGVLDDIKFGVGCALKIPRWFPTRGQSDKMKAAVAKLRKDFSIGDTPPINPNDHHYELCDPGWWKWWKAHMVAMKKWPAGLADFLTHDANRSFIYDDERKATKVALMSDFGVGQYHSKLIARQLEAKAYPYVFHLGDVYYGGTEREFKANYTDLLAETMKKSLLFSIPENHELYGGGKAWQKFLKDHKAQILQEGSYFCVRYAHHQIIGIDVNWQKRQRFAWKPSHDWLEHVLDSGGDRTNILLTGSAPFQYGEKGTHKLLEDLAPWTSKGKIAMWFWGDDHYCALFRRTKGQADFVGSCIGHAGFPGGTQKPGRDTPISVEWLENEPRFPSGYGLRSDLGNNGWVELTMLDTGGVELLYVDWLGCRRFACRYELDASAPGRQLSLVNPPEHFPGRVRSFP